MRFLLLLLIPVFFILHGVNENYGLIPIGTVAELALKYLAVSAIIYLLCSLLFRDKGKKFLFGFYLMVIYFFFGAFHDLWKDLVGRGFLVSYKFILPALLLVSLLDFILLRRYKKSHAKGIRFLTILMFILGGWELLSLGMNLLKGGHKRNDLSSGRDWFMSNTTCTSERKPDIYFIVLDGYTSSACLKEQFGFDNSRMDSLLHSAHFYISDSSKSNYNVTPFSLASTFNMDYLRKGIEERIVSSRIFMQSEQTLKNSGIPGYLIQKGYTIKNYGCFELKDAKLNTRAYFHGNTFRQIDGQTLSSRIRKDIWWNFSLKKIFSGAFRIPPSYKKEKEYHINRNMQNWDGLRKELIREESSPRFVMVHIMMPHEPFYLRADGAETSDTAILRNSLDQKDGYLNQLQFVNKLLENVLPALIKPSRREKVVIIQGDHGYRFYDKNVPRSREFMNLNAYYFSDGDTSMLYPGISPVNSFRVVLNKYLCDTLSMMPDSSIYLINNPVLLGK